jgi:hypothetical protein
MQTIWKFALPVEDEPLIRMPIGAKVLTVQSQGGYPCLWALVDPAAANEDRRFRVVGTGHPFAEADAHAYLGTFQMHSGSLVFHLFEPTAQEQG